MSPETWWYLARSSGIVAWLMLTASVLWGAALAMGTAGPRLRPAWILDLHRWLGGLAVTFTAIHVAALVADSYIEFGLADIVIPFASEWRPGAVAWGVVSLWILVAVEVTSLLRRRLSRRTWRAVHVTSYALFWTATAHGLTAGTDATGPVYAAAAVAVAWATLTATILRLLGPSRRVTARPRPAAPA